MFRDGEVHKTYWAIVKNMPKEPEATLTHWIVRNEKQNKSYAYDHEVKNSKKAILKYKVIGHTDHYTLLEVNLMTGRHHQIRCQLAKMGCPIKGLPLTASNERWLAERLLESANAKSVTTVKKQENAWANYQLSPEILKMTLKNRKQVSDAIDDSLYESLEEKYK